MKIRKLTLTLIVLVTVGILAGARWLYKPITAQVQPLETITETHRAQIAPAPKAIRSETTVNVNHKQEVTTLRKQLKEMQQRNLQQAEEIEKLSKMLETYIETDALSCDCDEEEYITAEQVAEMEAADKERLNKLDSAIMSEQIDVESSEAMSVYINQFLDSNALTDTSVGESSCYETLCRVTLDHQSEQAADQIASVSSTLLEISYHNGFEQFNNDDGTLTTVLYLAKAQIH